MRASRRQNRALGSPTIGRMGPDQLVGLLLSRSVLSQRLTRNTNCPKEVRPAGAGTHLNLPLGIEEGLYCGAIRWFSLRSKSGRDSEPSMESTGRPLIAGAPPEPLEACVHARRRFTGARKHQGGRHEEAPSGLVPCRVVCPTQTSRGPAERALRGAAALALGPPPVSDSQIHEV